MYKNLITAFPDDKAFDVLDKIENYGYGHIPIVDPLNSSTLLGIITKRDVLKARETKRKELIKNRQKMDNN
jgi:CBS domain-containing protein